MPRAAPEPDPEPLTPEIAATIDTYLDHLRIVRRVADNTIEAYGRDLTALGRFAAGRGQRLESLARGDLEALVRQLAAEGQSPRSVARAVSVIRGIFRYLVVSRRTGTSPADDLLPPRAWPALPRVLSLDDVERLIAAPDTGTPRGARDRAIVEVLYATGMRVSELVALRVTDLDLDPAFSPAPARAANSASSPWAPRRPRGCGATSSRAGRPCCAAQPPPPCS